MILHIVISDRLRRRRQVHVRGSRQIDRSHRGILAVVLALQLVWQVIERSFIERPVFQDLCHHLLVHFEAVISMHRVGGASVLFKPGSTGGCGPWSRACIG
jgi:hypothetical protein